ncbi:PLDc N-terminal domain-containing protein [Rhodococcus sp. NPDC127528]|uniref:PLDc N-terminal domain-containing protein n=1 Tax=unclassified Rhodococcus (in: high G+C Gram-positive bacteria) TaxID=192944 RepID=UPI00363867FE
MNPTIPLGFDLATTGFVTFWAVLTVAALVSVSRSQHDRLGSKFWWSALIIALPCLGASAWFLGRR